MSSAPGRFIFIFVLILNFVLWSRSRYGQPIQASLFHGGEASLVKRISVAHSPSPWRPNANMSRRTVPNPTPSSTSTISNTTSAQMPKLRPLVFTGLIVWLIFLFSTLGISASDFFTPNLATISQLLGLDENVAGVTFLAFGNGSPDVFSTFSAMRANSGSLAVGELLGAATFIVSCVVGSMCIIKPFQVNRTPFLRDVGFFAVAVSLVLFTLWDGKISAWEAGILVILYLVYVFAVVVGSWWERRQERRRHLEALERAEYAEEVFPRYTDDPVPTLSVIPPTPSRNRAVSAPTPPRLQITVPHQRHHSRSPSPSGHPAQLPSFSIVGALEFRDVVAALKSEAAGTSLGMFETPVTPYAGGHYHSHRTPRTSRSSLNSSIDEETLNGLQLGERPNASLPDRGRHDRDREQIDFLSTEPGDYFNLHTSPSQQSIPSILRTPASPSATISDVDTEEQLFTPPTKRQRVWRALGSILHTLFPTFHEFGKQSFASQIACILAAPAVLCLTLTLPVVVTPYESTLGSREKSTNPEARLVDFEEEGTERILIAEEEVEENLHELSFNKWLTATQCVLGPLFCVEVLFGKIYFASSAGFFDIDGHFLGSSPRLLWLLLGTGLTGLAAGILILFFSDKGSSPAARMARCSMGFCVAIVWIMAIADEVVNVLQTFGLIFGLSDAIIGLTIFAVGNSLADLVANMSVAVFAPIMGFSACFGGPMLNILLGVGVSGSYIISQTAEPYILNISTTLFVSGFGLLFLLAATLVFVPLNDYMLTRRWGVLLIATYAVIMTINVIVELKS
ncbi:hypothetical protein NLJ89_g8430 [Agrocybe chaxingu]|uniref:Sodium/calcium exchanger membrane region domain-containing protein n=1 Tax=Agrocybe chaxingu TaxID=84603 RepID=A0A9W8JUX1_9AGAR|nr:hypothetical protein NLJ89_g8430 [Agrocybe chaxingu]